MKRDSEEIGGKWSAGAVRVGVDGVSGERKVGIKGFVYIRVSNILGRRGFYSQIKTIKDI